MKTIKKNAVVFILLAALVLVIVSPGCKKKDEPAPEIPPATTMVMDFKDFKDTSSVTNKSTYVNWLHSAVNVGVWNIVLTVTLAIPVASFYESFNHPAEYHHQDEYWTWEYSFNSWGTHQAELTGFIEGDTVNWEMRIDNFLWYYGRSHTNKSGGYWMLNESKTQQTALLRIDYQRNSTGVSSIKYKNVAPASSTHYKNHGEYIEYGTVASAEYDRFYDIFLIDDNNTSENNLTEIEWAFSDKHGHVKDPKKFGDSEWHCWDTTFADASCQ
ncbi:MAG: hypothetical protein ABIJ16_07135 [Bacteroidota bacterium]